MTPGPQSPKDCVLIFGICIIQNLSLLVNLNACHQATKYVYMSAQTYPKAIDLMLHWPFGPANKS